MLPCAHTTARESDRGRAGGDDDLCRTAGTLSESKRRATVETDGYEKARPLDERPGHHRVVLPRGDHPTAVFVRDAGL